MANFARIINNIAVDVSTNPTSQFHPDLAKEFKPVPDQVQNNWRLVNGKWSAPESISPPRQWTQDNFRNAMSLSEKVNWDNDASPEIKTIKLELPRSQAEAQELVNLLVSAGVISQTTATKIMT